MHRDSAMAYWVIFGLLPCLEPIGKALKGSILKEMKQLALVLVTATCMWGCSTDLEINAPYEDITVVYGLLNPIDSIHFVKINKAYLGQGDALEFAQIADSNEWSTEALTAAKIHRVLNGQRISTFVLNDTLLTNREPGTFYSPNQRMYYFSDPFRLVVGPTGSQTTFYLDAQSTYELDLEVKGEKISALAPMVNDFSFQNVDQNLGVDVNFVNSSTGAFTNFELNWNSSTDGKRYVAEFEFNYSEVVGMETFPKSVRDRFGTAVSTNSSASEPLSVTLDGQQFYSTIAARTSPNAGVSRRIFTGLNFIVSVANEDFHTFLTLSEPVSGIIEDRPSFSNITNGYGIFAGRYTKSIIGKRLGPRSLDELCNGSITGSFGFCSGLPADVSSPNVCPE